MEKYLTDLIVWAQEQPEILAIYLFGSLPEGRAGRLSDVDVAILVKLEIPKSRLWRLEDQWLVQCPENFDLHILNFAPLSFRYEVMTRGQRLWAADLDAVATFESLSWRLYWDFRPKLEQDWQHYVEHAMERRDETERDQYQAALAKVRAVHQRVRETAANYAGKLQE
jgi:predicted nucleotidyltransferase